MKLIGKHCKNDANDQMINFAGYHDSCYGDSGGALVYYRQNRFYLHGLVSRGIGCGLNHIPAVYNRVSAYLLSPPELPTRVV